MSDDSVITDDQIAKSKAMALLVNGADLVWIGQTVHNAYHQPPEGRGGYWKDCRKSVCSFIADLIADGVK